MALPGFERLPGKRREYRTPRGRVISKRQYDRIRRAAQSGLDATNEEYARLRARERSFEPRAKRGMSLFQKAIANWKKATGATKARGSTETFARVVPSSGETLRTTFDDAWRRWMRFKHRKGTVSKEARWDLLAVLGFVNVVEGEWRYLPAV